MTASVRLRAGVVATILMGGIVVGSCDRPAGPDREGGRAATGAVSGFAHNQTEDLSGYYIPASEVAVGPWRLDHLFLGMEDEFTSWEGGRRSETFGPVMLEVSDTRSPIETGETGAQSHAVRLRLLADGYAVSDRSLRFTARHPQLGEVRFEGEIDAGVLAEAQRNLGGVEAPALTGDLTIAGRTVRDVRFSWWMGD